ncbi:Na/Pi symporter [Stappia sp.]|uniref:Na/Pi cotransporter family protein n=1 Tax=Stappia sp. TaxID=1870903 RepID=UPI0032D8D425
MTENVLLAAGGIGLFLFGMLVLTDGLRALAGGALRRTLARLTQSPASGAAAGAVTTALLQSSSATTVTAVGFVGAGLLTFPQAIGIVFGANIGTTMTGWLVALIGFKLDLGLLALPLLLVGALLRLFGRGTLRRIGWALAGFSLLFLGVDALKDGLEALQGTVTPQDFPADTTFGRLQLVAIGIAVTLITQSSSAGIAMALAALGSGAISLPQGAALVIGMDVGTTATAVLASLGGSTEMRRTAAAHVTFNLFVGTMAFFLLTPFALLVEGLADGTGDAQIALVAFHTAFNTLGVLIILPVAGRFARVIERLVPAHDVPHLVRLDPKLQAEPEAALDVAGANARDLAGKLDAVLAALLTPSKHVRDTETERAEIEAGIAALRSYLGPVHTVPAQGEAHRRNLALRHLLDHLARASHRATQRDRVRGLQDDARLRRLAGLLRAGLEAARDEPDMAACERHFDRLRRLFRRQRERVRERTIAAAAAQDIDPETALVHLDGVRWLHRVTYHLWRIAHHLARLQGTDAYHSTPSSAKNGKGPG